MYRKHTSNIQSISVIGNAMDVTIYGLASYIIYAYLDLYIAYICFNVNASHVSTNLFIAMYFCNISCKSLTLSAYNVARLLVVCRLSSSLTVDMLV